MREVKYSFMYTDGVEWLDYRFDMREILNGDPFDVISDSPLLRKFRMVCSRQFTGLKDKNGEEIYEGDIVNYTDLSGSGRPRVFGPRLIKWQDKGNFNISKPNSCGKFELIGNKFEHPELLEDRV